ncbi:MAG: hypothetical protein DCF20_19025 [Pseudanabaena sp.]|nr:MAG: hypothetical protein DCF20_19025 [Pseudanabaena sp.]
MSRVTSSLDLLAKVKLSGVGQKVVVGWGNNRELMQRDRISSHLQCDRSNQSLLSRLLSKPSLSGIVNFKVI